MCQGLKARTDSVKPIQSSGTPPKIAPEVGMTYQTRHPVFYYQAHKSLDSYGIDV
jgi:hypothetical protein